MATDKFFDETREQSIVKATIVEKYFNAWARIIAGAQNRHRPGEFNELCYVDLFAGPGRYKDGAASTPVRVLQTAIANPSYAKRLHTIFNDKDADNVRDLEREIQAIPGIATLTHGPVVWNEEVGDQIAKAFGSIQKIPTLAFIDPWGYKGLSLGLIDAFLRDWGCDCIFFFNYARINAGLSNPAVFEHMSSLFGKDRAAALRTELDALDPADREAAVVNALATALKEYGHRYVLPFCFKNDRGTRTTHHLILVTKSFKGYEVMKDIMAAASTTTEQGVASFTYCPADRRQRFLFDLNRPLTDLADILLADFAGQELTMEEIYKKHSVDRPYTSKNYKAVLTQLEKDGRIQTSARKTRRGFADSIRVKFPDRQS